ncbi:MAG: DUF3782 domain-containing protein [Thermoanaerobaculia bacterium]
MTEQELRDHLAEVAERLRISGEETDRRLRESGEKTDRHLRETDRHLRELGKQIGGLGEKFGSFTEGLALPSMTRILGQDFGMDVIAPRVRARSNGHSLEVDVLAWSNSRDEVVVVEVKSHLREEALDQMRKTLRDFRDFFPDHREKKIYAILAAVDAPDSVRDKALREGIYLARIHDGQFELQVPEGFQPRAF